MSSYLFQQKSLACRAHSTWIVSEMGGKWLYIICLYLHFLYSFCTHDSMKRIPIQYKNF